MAKKKAKSLTRSLAMKKSWAERRASPMREQARKRAQKKPAGEPRFWILWAPTSTKPPTIKFGTMEKVREVADIMVQKYRTRFYVMESVEVHQLSKPETIPCNAKPLEVREYQEKTKEERPQRAPYSLWMIPAPGSMQGQTWDQIQDDELCRMWYRGCRDLDRLSEHMGRSALAIEYRLEALGLRPRCD